MLCQNLPEGWLSWGTFCDARSRAEGSTAAETASWVQNGAAAYLQVPFSQSSSLTAAVRQMQPSDFACALFKLHVDPVVASPPDKIDH